MNTITKENRNTAAWKLVYKLQLEDVYCGGTEPTASRAGKAESVWTRAIRGNPTEAARVAVELGELTNKLVYDSTKTPAEVFYQLATAVVKAGGVLQDAQPRRPRGE